MGAPAVAVAMPTSPLAEPHTPTTASVQRELGKLAQRNSQLVEQFDRSQSAVHARAAIAKRAAEKVVSTARNFAKLRGQYVVIAAAAYERGAFSSTGALLSSDGSMAYLDKVETLAQLNLHTAQVLRRLEIARHEADSAKKAAGVALEAATEKRDHLVAQRKDVQRQIDKYTKLLDSLKAAARRAYLRRANPSVSTVKVASLRKSLPQVKSTAAAQAVKYALAQVGKPYVFGSAGPGSFDCSGLTMAAWASAGVSLPHFAAAQYNYGKRVSFDQLEPGDLMFFYTPISHVTIYIGNGYMVSAPETGENVSVVPARAFGNAYVGAVQLTSG